MNEDFAALADSMLESMRAYCDTFAEKCNARVAELDARLAALRDDHEALLLICDERIAAIPAGPAGKDGKDGERGEIGEKGERGIPGEDGRDGLDGKEGAPGRDAFQVIPIPSIDPTRRYQRGTYACHNGGTVCAFRATDPLEGRDLESAGWQITCNGVHVLHPEYTITTDGQKAAVRLQYPDKGDFDPNGEYKAGDLTRFRGSVWQCLTPTSSMPGGTDGSWKMWLRGVKTDSAHYLGVVEKRKA